MHLGLHTTSMIISRSKPQLSSDAMRERSFSTSFDIAHRSIPSRPTNILATLNIQLEHTQSGNPEKFCFYRALKSKVVMTFNIHIHTGFA